MGKATDLENIRWRAELLKTARVEEGDRVEVDDIKELAELVLGLVEAIESAPDIQRRKEPE